MEFSGDNVLQAACTELGFPPGGPEVISAFSRPSIRAGSLTTAWKSMRHAHSLLL